MEVEEEENDALDKERTTEGKESSRETLVAADADGEETDAALEVVGKEDDESASEDNENYDEGKEEEEEDATEDISLEADALQAELEKVVIRFSISSEPEMAFNVSDFPRCYQENSKREKTFLSYAENFREQYCHLYPNRRPLLLFPVNEFGMEKFVCTTIRPASLPFGEFYEWSGASKFVADHLRYVPLSPPYDLPSRLLSPTTLLSLKKGHCFEYATLLASLLLGAGYDAYVVSGYAVKEVCLMDESRDICRLLLPLIEIPPPKPQVEKKKYVVHQPKELFSKYEMWMESRRLKAIADKVAKKQKEENDKKLLAEIPPADPLHGWRIHAWVLVLDGKREIGTPFFIEPLTGVARPTVSPLFLGIESIWNQFNYWVNMQKCSNGLGSLVYDLQDWTLWEYLIPTNEKLTINVKVDKEEDVVCPAEEVKEKDDDIEKHLDLPPPWVRAVCLSHKNFEQRYPNGTKVTIYKRAKVEDFAPYILPDGLIRRILIYEDVQMTKLQQVKEYYANRVDKLTLRTFDFMTSWISKYFAHGRPRHLKEYHCKAIGKIPHAERTMVFYHKSRFDCLERRVETPLDMVEHFVDRDDFLNYIYIKFSGPPLKYGSVITIPRPTDKIIVRYDRNSSKPANEDVKEIIFDVEENTDDVTYYYEDDKITSSTREFIMPIADEIKYTSVLWDVDNHSTYQVVETRKPKRRYEVYQMMLDLLNSEEAFFGHIHDSQLDVKYLLDELRVEDIECELEVAVHDIGRNDKAQKHRKQLERQKMEEETAKQEVKPDFLSPFITQIVFQEQSPPVEESAVIGDNELPSSSFASKKKFGHRVTLKLSTSKEFSFTRQRAHLLRELCLADFKQRMVDIASLIQVKFEKESDNLKRKQIWYHQNQISLKKEDQREYLAFCCETMFRIRVLEARLDRHKQTAPLRYLAMDQRIRLDPRMSAFF